MLVWAFRIIGIIIIPALFAVGWSGVLPPGESADFNEQEISVAVASNFTNPINAIARNFEEKTGCRVVLAFGSTGRHYAQIKNGAPFEVFLAADERRPALLEEEGLAVSGSRFTYAFGRLVLWSPQDDYVDSLGQVLKKTGIKYIAMANPKLAPYGMAAQEVLQTLGLWDRLQDHLVRGENIGQTYQFIKSGNADLGFVAYSQVINPGEPLQGSLWVIPQKLYTPIEQQAILLKDKPAARAFLEYLRSPETLEIIRSYGYGTP
jgi:molybdate transport system substrate-binding protein